MNGYAVIGANNGDEGKGKQVDYLCSKVKNPIVVRHNGGCQAGHTVVTPEGEYHVFKHLGSGTFLDVPTYLAMNFIVNPIQFKIEYTEMIKRGFFPSVYVSDSCFVTSPYDMLINQLLELSRGTKRHGSCGYGINETEERNRYHFKDFGLNIVRLQNKKTIKDYLINIKDQYTKSRLWNLGITKKEIKKEYLEILENPNLINRYLEDCEFFLDNVNVQGVCIPTHFDNAIFEGAQGLLLDEDNNSFFPHVTRSKTGLTNIIKQCKNNDINDLKVYYMSRSYLTRHGAGPLPNERKLHKPYPLVVDKTNIYNDWQGALRYAYLDIDLLKKSIEHDLSRTHFCDNIKITPNLCFTCMDQVGERVKYFENGIEKDVYVGKTEGSWFTRIMSDKIGIPVTQLSYGPKRTDIVEV